METRPPVPRTGTAPRSPVGHHPTATRHTRNASCRPGYPMGGGTQECHEGREEGSVARWRAHPRDGGAPNPLGYGQGRLGGGLSR